MRRGKINHRDRAKQINDFQGLLYGRNGTITPTDVDGLIEYENKAYVIIEIKSKDHNTKEWFEKVNGQRIALERLTDDLTKAEKPAICILASHNIEDPEYDVNVATTTPIAYRRNKKWTWCKNCTTKEVIDKFIRCIDPPPRTVYDILRLPEAESSE